MSDKTNEASFIAFSAQSVSRVSTNAHVAMCCLMQLVYCSFDRTLSNAAINQCCQLALRVSDTNCEVNYIRNKTINYARNARSVEGRDDYRCATSIILEAID